MDNIKVSCFTKIVNATLNEKSWNDVTATIKTNTRLAKLTADLRQSVITNNWDLKNGEHKKAYQKLKTNTLPGFLPGGTFVTVNKEDLIQYSAIVHVDFDNLTSEQEVQLMQFACDEESVVLCFKSPGGQGLKIFHKVSASKPLIDVDYEVTQQFHTQAFKHIKSMYHSKGLLFPGFDDSVSNINRACYLSSDPNAFIRENVKPVIIDSTISTVNENETESEKSKTEAKAIEDWYRPQVEKYISVNADEAGLHIERLIQWLQEKKFSITSDYGKWIRVIFALKANFTPEVAEQYARDFSKQDTDFNEKEFKKKFNQKIKTDKAPSLSTIFYYAKELGYKPPRSNKIDFFSAFINALATHGWRIRYNTMTGRLEKLYEQKWTPLSDMDMDEIKVGVFNHRMHREPVRETLNVITPKHNPAYELQKLIPAWDGENHIEALLLSLDCGDTKWPRIFLTRWLIGMLAGITQPESYNENILVLHGHQGAGKTRWVRKLFTEAFSAFQLEPERYFRQKQIDPASKDDLLLLCTSFVVFFDEMSSIVNNKADIEAFKNMTSATTQTIRKPYGRESEDLRRYASIIATVNEEQFLVDSTGNRRFWIISAKNINHDHGVNSVQVFAQAMHLLKTGHPHYLNAAEIKELNETYQTRYEIVRSEEELIRAHVVESDGRQMTTTDVIKELNELYNKDMIKCGPANFGKLLRKYYGHVYEATKKGRFYRVTVVRAGLEIKGITSTIGVGYGNAHHHHVLSEDQQSAIDYSIASAKAFLAKQGIERKEEESPSESFLSF